MYSFVAGKGTYLLFRNILQTEHASLSQQCLPDNYRGLPGYGERSEWLSGICSKKPSIQREARLMTIDVKDEINVLIS